MRRLAMMLALVLPLAGVAAAGDKEDAIANCTAAATLQVEKENLSPDQIKQMMGISAQLCDCVCSKISQDLGADGEKVLRVLAKTPPEKAAENTDPAKDKANQVEVLMAEYGMSAEEAGALYDSVNPKVEAIANQCVADIMGAAAPK